MIDLEVAPTGEQSGGKVWWRLHKILLFGLTPVLLGALGLFQVNGVLTSHHRTLLWYPVSWYFCNYVADSDIDAPYLNSVAHLYLGSLALIVVGIAILLRGIKISATSNCRGSGHFKPPPRGE